MEMFCCIQRLFLGALLTTLILPISGCSSSTKSKPQVVVVGVETIPEQALKEIQSSQTTFTVPVSESIAAWDRARMFFLQYQGATNVASIESEPAPAQTLLTNESIDGGKYLYEVTRKPTSDGAVISVRCVPRGGRGSSANATRNAKNLSRFIRQGTLEISFLDR